MKNFIITLALTMMCHVILAQQDSILSENTAAPGSFTISGYVEPYYSYDFSNPDNHLKPGFFYSFNRHNEVTLNLGLIKANYTTARARANVGLMTGTYTQYNLAAEPNVLQHIFEANAGYKLSENADLWLDAGIMPSHIGFESAIGKDNWVLTRSLLAENSPYFEAGARLSYTSPNEQWYLAALYLNGWQRIVRPEGNNTPAFGTQITFYPNDAVTLNWSTFIGNDKPDAARQWRFFNNFYGIFQLTNNFGITAGFDIGMEEKSKGESDDNNIWFSPIIITRLALNNQLALGARAEYYSDENGVIIATETPNGFKTFGYSLNVDYQISDNALFRIEGRALNSEDEIFTLNNEPSNNNYFITTSLGISF